MGVMAGISTMVGMGIGSDSVQLYSITLFVALLCACIVIGHLFEENRWINESITALLIGLCCGTILLLATKGKSSRILEFDEQLFFIYLLPPIIFNAGFQVKKKQFFRNFMTIMLFGAVGTLISFCIISFGAKSLFENLDIGSLELRDYLAIGAIFSATDSVCTLQVLNQDDTPLLYSLVFGEGVVNDATSVVLFNAIQRFDISHANSKIAVQFLGNFLTLFITSTFLGIGVNMKLEWIISFVSPSNALRFFLPDSPLDWSKNFKIGLLCAYLIKNLYLARHSTDREVALMMLMAYLSYVISEMLNLSGILTAFFCGIVMSHYTWHNVTQSSRTTTKHAFATLSFVAEVFIFLYVGMDALDMEKWKFVSDSPGKSIVVSAALFGLVLVGRASFIFPLSFLSNLSRKSESEKIDLRQQVTIWWAGLMRGAVSMALAYNQFARSGHTQQPGNAIMITSTITIVLFSTAVLGLMTKPLISFLLVGSILPVSCEPASPRCSLIPLLDDDEESGDGKESSILHRASTLRMLLTTPTYTIHYHWRKFDDSVMRPVFGGRGFTRVDSGSSGEASLY